ncbi:MAG: peptidylprolyl isomerase [Candidatus Omnitrophica bacterium]|nr:peptidylprolyl isomerase [Candidatus Omnitrophota bacterium]
MKENKFGRIALAAVTVLLGAGLVIFTGCGKSKTAPSAARKDVVANINGDVITMKDVDERISKLPPYYQNMVKGRKKELVDDMVLEKILYSEALKKGLQNDKEVKEMVEEAQRKIMISKLIKDDVEEKTKVSDQQIEEYYNTHKDEFYVPEKWRASHILVKTEEEAAAILDELSKGASFEELAKTKSQDSSAQKGGDLGYFTKGQMVPEFEEAVTKLEVGQLSPVVKTQFGYHIIKLTDKKPAEQQDLKSVSAKISNELLANKKREAFDKLVSGLRAKANVKINESLLEEKKEEIPEK